MPNTTFNEMVFRNDDEYWMLREQVSQKEKRHSDRDKLKAAVLTRRSVKIVYAEYGRSNDGNRHSWG
jgi:hypothetical protein